MSPRKEMHKKKPLPWLIITAIIRIIVEFGAIASGIEYLIRFIKSLGRL